MWGQPRQRPGWVAAAYHAYSADRQTLGDLALRYNKSTRTLRRHFDKYTPSIMPPAAPREAVALAFDATYFGRGYGLMIYRAEGRNIHWQEIESET